MIANDGECTQRTFRTALFALAEPAQPLEMTSRSSDSGLLPTTAEIVGALVDVDTPLWVSSMEPPLKDWIAFRTGARIVTREADAIFAVVRRADAMPDLGSFAQGTAEYPDRSATVIVEVEGFEGEAKRFDGPGFERARALAVSPWPDRFEEMWCANAAAYPLGVDLLFVSDSHVAGLPRSARLVEDR